METQAGTTNHTCSREAKIKMTEHRKCPEKCLKILLGFCIGKRQTGDGFDIFSQSLMTFPIAQQGPSEECAQETHRNFHAQKDPVIFIPEL